MSAAVIEKELTCSICTELLFDPVTLLNCLHHNCGACAKRWFSSQPHNPPTCPVCRRAVKGAGVSPIVVSILSDFLSRYPDRGRTPAEQEDMRVVWKPGDELLPPTIPRGDEGMENRRTHPGTIIRNNSAHNVSMQRVRPPRSNSDPPPNSMPLMQVERQPRSTSPRLLSRLLSPPPEESLQMQMQYYHPPRPRPRSPAPPPLPSRRPSLPPSVPPSSVLEILQRGISPIIITCDHCSKRLDTSVHLECASCPLFHLCLRCFRAGQTCLVPTHYLTRQKLIASWPRRYLQVGMFCDVCDAWLDEDRNGGARVDAMFWRCGTCNDGRGWVFCTRCVQRGWNCTHELEMWSNSRTTTAGSGSLVRGCARREGYTPFLFMALTEAVACTLCKLAISPVNTQFLHCFGCTDGHGELCTTCFYNLHRTFPSPSRGMHAFYPCPRGHAMAVLAQPGKRVLHRGVFAHAPKPRAPEWIVAAGVGRRALAVRGHWPEEEEREGEVEEGGREGRKWGRGQWLCFPMGAEVLDVVRAFEAEEVGGREDGGEDVGGEGEGDGGVEGVGSRGGGERAVEWFWGSYAGVGGLFPGGYVRFF